LIKINLVREGRAVRGAGAAPAAAVAASGPANLNNILIIGLAVLGALLAGGYWLLQKRALSNRQEVVAARTAEAAKLEAIIKDVEEYQKRKDNLQSRIDLINQLKQNQRGPVRIMDRISQDLPDLVWLESMQVDGGKITLSGRGLNPNAIANFVENVKNDPYFEEPELGMVSMMTPVPLVYSFDMNFAFSYSPKDAANPTGTTTGTGTGTGTATGTSGTGKP
jgi:type IV pilus assembly protein PilN